MNTKFFEVPLAQAGAHCHKLFMYQRSALKDLLHDLFGTSMLSTGNAEKVFTDQYELLVKETSASGQKILPFIPSMNINLLSPDQMFHFVTAICYKQISGFPGCHKRILEPMGGYPQLLTGNKSNTFLVEPPPLSMVTNVEYMYCLDHGTTPFEHFQSHVAKKNKSRRFLYLQDLLMLLYLHPDMLGDGNYMAGGSFREDANGSVMHPVVVVTKTSLELKEALATDCHKFITPVGMYHY